MAIQWLRLWHDMPNDPKWRTIARASSQPITAVISVYLHVLVCASNATERGRTQSVCSEDIASALDLECAQVEEILSAMQGRVLDGDRVSGWEKRQVAREDGAAERAKAWREAKKAETERSRTQTERKQTPDKDKDKDKDKEQTLGQETAPAKPSRVATKQKFDPIPEKPKNVSEEMWAYWCQHRADLKKPLTEAGCKMTSRDLESHPDPDSVIANSIKNGWQGLFTEKIGATGQPHKYMTTTQRVEANNRANGDEFLRMLAEEDAIKGEFHALK